MKGERMKRMTMIFAVLASVACLSLGVAFADMEHGAAKATSVRGELVDMGCYLGHTAKGEKHTECAAKCIAGGMPMGVLTSTGQLYLLTMDHANPDAYNKAKEMAGKQVKVSGPSHMKNGIHSIDAVSVEVIAAAPAGK